MVPSPPTRTALAGIAAPFAVWLCEIIMQQTRIDQGLKYWNTFVNTWTDVHALASAPLDDVLKAWQGLGYYSRARNLTARLRPSRLSAEVHFQRPPKRGERFPVGPTRLQPLHPFASTSP